jgi:hypothetical protein
MCVNVLNFMAVTFIKKTKTEKQSGKDSPGAAARGGEWRFLSDGTVLVQEPQSMEPSLKMLVSPRVADATWHLGPRVVEHAVNKKNRTIRYFTVT